MPPTRRVAPYPAVGATFADLDPIVNEATLDHEPLRSTCEPSGSLRLDVHPTRRTDACPVDELPDSDAAQPATVDAVVVGWLKQGSSQRILMMALRPSRMSPPNRETLVESGSHGNSA